MVRADVVVENTCADSVTPTILELKNWVKLALAEHVTENYQIHIQIVNKDVMQLLNSQFRHQDKPTNVLSFPANIPKQIPMEYLLLGDIAICADIVNAEAHAQNKSVHAHWAHMVVHGCLHLLGYDHIEDTAALEMENLEAIIITNMGFAHPYQ